MLKDNPAAAVAYKDLKEAKDNITKAFKTLENISKAHKSDISQMATDDYKAAVTKVQRLVMIIQACLLQQMKQSASAHACSYYFLRTGDSDMVDFCGKRGQYIGVSVDSITMAKCSYQNTTS